MQPLQKISLLLSILALGDATTTTKDVRTAGLPEKIIGGVIEIVHSHKNKPVPQQYPSTGYQPYQPQYQQPQQWNGQSNYQNQPAQGFNYQGQYQNQGQSQGQYYQNPGYNQGTAYPQTTGTYGGQTYPPGGFSNAQTQSQNQYQVVYQNQPSGQYGTTNQYQNNQSNQQFQQNQPSNTFQNTGNYQGQKFPSNNYQGQTGTFQQGGESGGQSFQVSQGHQTSGTAGGPTCVCQAWTKPTDPLNDPAADKNEKMSDEPAM